MSSRIFTAIDIGKDLRDSIYSYSLKTFSGNSSIRVIPAENLHITLKFIGKTEEEKIEDIKDVIAGTLTGIGQFDLYVENELGAFPRLNRARVAFIGIDSGSSRIKEIFDRLEPGLEEIGIAREDRDFHPHITVARIKNPLDLTGITRNSGFIWTEPVWIRSVALYKSILGRQGAKYINIGNFSLK